MGCDIHAYIEIVKEDEPELAKAFGPDIQCFADVDISRNYALFALMANVRNGFGEHRLDPVAAPKGIPAQISSGVHSHYYDFISGKPGELTVEQAEKWVNEGSSHWDKDHKQVTHFWVSSPDWHSASWLGVQELEEVQRRFAAITFTGLGDGMRIPYGQNPELAAIIAMMRAISDFGLGTPRLTFWFDN